MKDALLKLLRAINLRGLFDAIALSVSGPVGWFLRLIGGPVVSGIEKTIDSDIDETIAVDDADAAAAAKAAADIKAAQEAKTDDEFDKATRDSLN